MHYYTYINSLSLFGHLLFKVFNCANVVLDRVVRLAQLFLDVRVRKLRLNVLVLLFDCLQRLLQLAEIAVVLLEEFVLKALQHRFVTQLLARMFINLPELFIEEFVFLLSDLAHIEISVLLLVVAN